jgi:carboxyl-terminal processing protease
LAIAAIASTLSVLLGWALFPGLPLFGQTQTDLFTEVWQTVEQNFYDSELRGVDWNAMRQKYEPQVKQAQSRSAAATMINQMLAELKTSHTYLYTSDEPAYYQVLGIFLPRSSELQEKLKEFIPAGKPEYVGIGVFTQTVENKTLIRAILDGSPAAIAGLQVGDEIVSVAGQPFHPIQSFANQAGQSVTMRIQRSTDTTSQEDVNVTPKVFDGINMFLDAMQASIRVIEHNNRKIGYVHIWSYAGEQYQQLLEEELLYGKLQVADALVLDLREGWGGAPLTALNIYTAKPLSVTSIPRDRERYKSHSKWTKPVVLLVNEGSRSAKEILAYGFQEFDIGPVVGAKTAGAVVAGRPFLMKEGSLLYIAVADVYVNETVRLEGVGVIPDISAPFNLPYAAGADPQLERAIAIAQQQVEDRKVE